MPASALESSELLVSSDPWDKVAVMESLPDKLGLASWLESQVSQIRQMQKSKSQISSVQDISLQTQMQKSKSQISSVQDISLQSLLPFVFLFSGRSVERENTKQAINCCDVIFRLGRL